MLLVETRLGPSRIHGIGLMAHRPIARGAVVWQLHEPFDLLLPEAAFLDMPPPARRAIAYYAPFHPLRRSFTLSGDDDRMTNHSDHPNTEMAYGADGTWISVATRSIAIGEEITIDYRGLGWTWFCGMPARYAGMAPPLGLNDLTE